MLDRESIWLLLDLQPLPPSEHSTLVICATPRCANPPSPPHSPLLCLIPRSLSSRSPGLSKRLGAIKYSSALINCSSSPFWRRRRRKRRKGGRKNDIELFRGPQSGAISGNRIDLDETARRAPVFVYFWCGGSIISASSVGRHNYGLDTI